MNRIGFCRTCQRQTSEDTLVCPHCGQEAPFDRYEDLALGHSYPAEHTGMATEDMHWFKLRSSGRRVFARITDADRDAVREGGAEHWLELVSFDGGFPNFRYTRRDRT